MVIIQIGGGGDTIGICDGDDREEGEQYQDFEESNLPPQYLYSNMTIAV